MNILVTGGAGFIGSNLVYYLLNNALHEHHYKPHRVVVLDKLTYAGNKHNLARCESDERYTFIQGDINDSELVYKILNAYSIDVVFHLAAESHVDRSIHSPSEFITTNIVGTFQLLETFRKYVSETGDYTYSRFIHVSTDEVYGSLKSKEPAFDELSRYKPTSPYSASKASSDHLARSYYHTYDLPIIVTNCSNNYGPFQFPEKLIPSTICKTLRGVPLPIYGNGTQVRDWIYVMDHCSALVATMINSDPGETYVIGGRCEMRNINVVRSIVDNIREMVPNIATADELITYVEDRPGHDYRYAVNPLHIEDDTSWKIKESFTTGLHSTIKWYIENDEWIQSIETGKYRE